jgi:hypothetical protein
MGADILTPNVTPQVGRNLLSHWCPMEYDFD